MFFQELFKNYSSYKPGVIVHLNLTYEFWCEQGGEYHRYKQ